MVVMAKAYVVLLLVFILSIDTLDKIGLVMDSFRGEVGVAPILEKDGRILP